MNDMEKARANLEKGMAALTGMSAKALKLIADQEEEMNRTDKALERFRKAETFMWGFLVIGPAWAEYHLN